MPGERAGAPVCALRPRPLEISLIMAGTNTPRQHPSGGVRRAGRRRRRRVGAYGASAAMLLPRLGGRHGVDGSRDKELGNDAVTVVALATPRGD